MQMAGRSFDVFFIGCLSTFLGILESRIRRIASSLTFPKGLWAFLYDIAAGNFYRRPAARKALLLPFARRAPAGAAGRGA